MIKDLKQNPFFHILKLNSKFSYDIGYIVMNLKMAKLTYHIQP